DDARNGVYDVTTGECLQEIGRHEGGLWSAAFRPDGRQLLTGDKPGAVQFWPLLSGDQGALPAVTVKEPLRAAGHTGMVHGVAYSADGKRALSVGEDGAVRVWETDTGRKVGEFQGPPGAGDADFLPDGDQVLSAHSDGELRLWVVATGKEVRRFGKHEGPVSECFVVPGGQRAL